MSTLYVTDQCPHSQRAKSMLANAPTVVRRHINVKDANFSNSPPHVTKVPTLILQDGSMLVGPEVFQYLERVRQDPTFPQTPEMSEISEMFGSNSSCIVIVLLVLLGVALFVKS